MLCKGCVCSKHFINSLNVNWFSVNFNVIIAITLNYFLREVSKWYLFITLICNQKWTLTIYKNQQKMSQLKLHIDRCLLLCSSWCWIIKNLTLERFFYFFNWTFLKRRVSISVIIDTYSGYFNAVFTNVPEQVYLIKTTSGVKWNYLTCIRYSS